MTLLRSGDKLGLMKKLFLYIFLVLMWCNVGFADQILLNCKIKETDLKAIAKSDRQRFVGKTISLTIDTEEKIIINNNLDDETLLLHGIYGQVKLTDVQRRKSENESKGITDALNFFGNTYTYTNEIPLNDEDQTVYKFKGGIKLKIKKLEVAIDANRGAVTEMILKDLKFEFDCRG